MEGKINESIIGEYKENILMMMYDSVMIIDKNNPPKLSSI